MLSLIHVRTQRAEWGPARHRSAGLFDLGLPASRAVTSRSMSAVQAAQSWYFVIRKPRRLRQRGRGRRRDPAGHGSSQGPAALLTPLTATAAAPWRIPRAERWPWQRKAQGTSGPQPGLPDTPAGWTDSGAAPGPGPRPHGHDWWRQTPEDQPEAGVSPSTKDEGPPRPLLSLICTKLNWVAVLYGIQKLALLT